jgi:hypothetical protein
VRQSYKGTTAFSFCLAQPPSFHYDAVTNRGKELADRFGVG